MPPDIFALLLAAFEMATGILILSKGRYVKIGLVASMLFNLFLVQLGLRFPEIPWTGRDFLLNRLPTLLFALLQLPLFWVHFDKSLPDLLSTLSDHPNPASDNQLKTGQREQLPGR